MLKNQQADNAPVDEQFTFKEEKHHLCLHKGRPHLKKSQPTSFRVEKLLSKSKET